nr:DUF2235 domain-containing protein [Pseudomonas sp. R5(2019)]
MRLGVFFDGTGNNLGNSESGAQCAGGSYDNDPSNIARLYALYRDQADVPLPVDATQACLAIYVEGIGTRTGQADALFSQGTGRGSEGVLARVEQSVGLIHARMQQLLAHNPDIDVARLEFDLFGFSRGAVAARHFANDLNKGSRSLLAQALPAGSRSLRAGFAWRQQVDLAINFIGLFDSVAAFVAPLRGDFDPSNARYHGINVGLAPGIAGKVVQLVARDERRHNFPLICTDNDIVLPGVHSDLGGGYRPCVQERLLLHKPVHCLVAQTLPDEQSTAFVDAQAGLEQARAQWQAYGFVLQVAHWSRDQPYDRHRDLHPEKRVYAALQGERQVQGDLSRVYLAIMRELALREQVPLVEISPPLAPCEALQPIAAKLMGFALGDTGTAALSEAEEALLKRNYIHLSAHWNAAKGLNSSALDAAFLNRPSATGVRQRHPNQ